MSTFTYTIDDNKIATGKQFNAVCNHYANILATKLNLTSQSRYVLFNRMRGAVGHYFGSVLNSQMTHGDVQKAFDSTVVPSDILISIKIPADETAPVVSKETPVVSDLPLEATKRGRGRPKGSKNKVSKETPAVSKETPKDLASRVNALETKVSGVDDKLTQILQILAAK